MVSSAASKAAWMGRNAAFYAVVLAVLAAFVLVASDTRPAEAALSGKNGKIAFTSYRDGNPEIYAMNQYGPYSKNLTFSTEIDGGPAWSPDGKKIAFASYRDGNHEVYAMNADGTGLTQLTNNTVYDGDPAYSPDGKQIAFVSERDGKNEIYRMGAGGGSPLRLTYVDDNLSPSWQPLP